ncbi:hypothetical protein CDL12_21193 [Handroanthus impetiginosus]|uniref:Wound-responsive family protein n=1 Tax=Handroanthus impetiginosus TaxID=429701 RepID=A0A2G9GLV5_9LAMI|nr:hypothetical protein CDL12_21193 [Handroanthus impetiginosus]
MSGKIISRGDWIVATSIGAVEALKDQLGVCRWNYVLRSIQQNANSNIQTRLYSPNCSSSSSPSAKKMMMGDWEKNRRTEKCLKKVMDLSCLGPTTIRF